MPGFEPVLALLVQGFHAQSSYLTSLRQETVVPLHRPKCNAKAIEPNAFGTNNFIELTNGTDFACRRCQRNAGMVRYTCAAHYPCNADYVLLDIKFLTMQVPVMQWPERLCTSHEKIAIIGSSTARLFTECERRNWRSGLADTSTHATSISVAATDDELRLAANLVQSAYAGLGYDTGFLASPNLSHRKDPKRLTILACLGSQPAGTLTAFLDGQGGIQADQAHPEGIDAIRATGRPVVEFGQFAALSFDHLQRSQRVVCALLNGGYLLCASLNRPRILVVSEVNPHHVKYWCSLGWQVAGPPRRCARVNAPGVLMVLDFDAYAQTLQQCWPLHTRRPEMQHGPWYRLVRYSMLWEDIGGVLARVGTGSGTPAATTHRHQLTVPATPLEVSTGTTTTPPRIF